jgi:hypothetical protein
MPPSKRRTPGENGRGGAVVADEVRKIADADIPVLFQEKTNRPHASK